MQPKEYNEEWLNSPAGSSKSDKKRTRLPAVAAGGSSSVDKYRVLDTPAAAMVGARKGKAHPRGGTAFFVPDTEQVSGGVRLHLY